jgi:hypothetical protein
MVRTSFAYQSSRLSQRRTPRRLFEMKFRLMTMGWLIGGATLVSPALAQQQDAPAAGRADGAPSPTIATETPTVAYTHSGFGVSQGTFGGAGYGESRGGFSPANPNFGGGVRLWWSPIDRLTLFLDAERREGGERAFAPSASVQVRLLGDRKAGWALSALARYKAEAFAELGGEAEFAVLGSYARRGFHLDGNTIFGVAFEEAESDGELLARAGYDVLPFLRVGGEGRVRVRFSGDVTLPGGRTWDMFMGPQVLGYYGAFFGALTAGPSTVGIENSVGWLANATVGGAMF